MLDFKFYNCLWLEEYTIRIYVYYNYKLFIDNFVCMWHCVIHCLYHRFKFQNLEKYINYSYNKKVKSLHIEYI